MAKPSGQRNASIEELKQRMSRDPLSRAFLQLAEEYRKSGHFEDAVRVCQEGLERHPGYHTARISLGRTYLESGDLENARSTLAEVLELAPENHLAGKLLAEVQRSLGDQSGAVETYRAILRHYPGDREVETLLNDLQQGGGSHAAATPRALPTAPSAQVVSPASPSLQAAPARQVVGPAPGAPPDPPARIEPALPDPPAPVEPMPPAPDDDQPFLGVSLPRPPERLEPALPATRSARPAVRPAAPERPLPGPIPSASVALSPSPLPLVSGVIPRSPQGRRDDARDEEQPDALQTNTLAELYLRQGLVDRAVEVYRSMLRVDPGNVRARRRLGELSVGSGKETESPGGQEDESIVAPEPRAQSDIAVPPALMIAPQPDRLESSAGPRQRRQTIDRLEKWLGTIRRQEPDPPGGPLR